MENRRYWVRRYRSRDKERGEVGDRVWIKRVEIEVEISWWALREKMKRTEIKKERTCGL